MGWGGGRDGGATKGVIDLDINAIVVCKGNWYSCSQTWGIKRWWEVKDPSCLKDCSQIEEECETGSPRNIIGVQLLRWLKQGWQGYYNNCKREWWKFEYS